METYIQSPAFKARIEAMMRSHHVPGMSIAIVQKDLIATASWGAASLDPPQPCTSDTLFDIASFSKSLTAASVALLVDDDEANPEVQWDSLMSELLPDDFIMPSASYTEGVTVDDVLGHRTGMSRCALLAPSVIANPTTMLKNWRMTAVTSSRSLASRQHSPTTRGL